MKKDPVLNKIINTFYKKSLKNDKIITEAESNFKGGPLKSNKTKTFFYWLHSSQPATFDIDFKYKVIFDLNTIEGDFTRDGENIEWEDFYYDVVKKNFSERNVYIKAKYINVGGFKVAHVIYNSEATDKTLNPKRSIKYDFKHTVTLEALDKKKVYKKPEIIKAAQEFVDKFEKVAYSDTKYYKITK